MASYIPETNGALRDWSQNFAALITANPFTYGLTAPDALTITTAANLYAAALTLSTDPGTKTKATVADKDAKKAAMLVTLRRYAQLIKLNNGVTNEEKIALGLTVNDTTHTPVPAPTTQPICSIIAALPLKHILRFADAATPTRRGKPPGATGLELFYFVGPTPPLMPDDSPGVEYYGQATRQPYGVNHKAENVGKLSTYWARWTTATALTGPFSAPVSMTIAA